MTLPINIFLLFFCACADSDDSESEGGQGNVSRVVIRPHGHSGKAKKGHLCFDAAFETGNLGRVDLINEFEYDLFIRPDTCNPRYRGWFHFTVDNIRPDQQNRRADLLTITSPNNMELPYGVPIVVVLCRSHPGEPSSSFVCQGLIDFLSSSHPTAVLLRKFIVFKVVPMLNPDGVFLGNQRCSLLGLDLNRAWQDAPPFSHPTVDAIINLLTDLNGRQDIHLDFIVDIHGHTAIHGAFIYGNWYDDVYRFERHILFPKLLSQNAEDFNLADTLYNRDPLKAGTARRYLCSALKDSVNCYSLFASIHGFHRAGHPNFLTYSDEGYFRLGRNIARTFLDYYHMIGIIPQTILAPLTPKQGTANRRRRIRRRRKRLHTSAMTSTGPPPSRQRNDRVREVASATAVASSGEEDLSSSPHSGAGSPTMMPKPLKLRALSLPPPTPSSLPPALHFAFPQGLPLGTSPIMSGTSMVRGLRSGLQARRKVGGRGFISSAVDATVVVTSSLPVPNPPPAPSLSIIDMNERACGGLPRWTSSPSPSPPPPATPGAKAHAHKRAGLLRHTCRGKTE